MGLISSYTSEPLPPGVIKEYLRRIQPDVYVVGHLEREIQAGGYVRRGSVLVYDKEAYKLVANVSKRVFGKSAYRKRPKHRKRLPNMATLERLYEWPHLNILIRKPDDWTIDEFSQVVREEWAKLRWRASSPEDLYCKPHRGRAVRYSLKEGNDSLLQRSLCFYR